MNHLGKVLELAFVLSLGCFAWARPRSWGEGVGDGAAGSGRAGADLSATTEFGGSLGLEATFCLCCAWS